MKPHLEKSLKLRLDCRGVADHGIFLSQTTCFESSELINLAEKYYSVKLQIFLLALWGLHRLNKAI